MLYQTAHYASVGTYQDFGIIGVGSKQMLIKDRELWENVAIILHEWLSPNTKDDIEKIVSSKNYFHHQKNQEAFDIIYDNHLIMVYDVFKLNDRYSRNFLYFNHEGADPILVQEKLKNSSVTIIGCGGIGNHISSVLATAGVGHIHLVDSDIIETSNLTRQVLFSEKDIQQLKTEVLYRELTKRNSEIKITTQNINIQSEYDVFKLEPSDLYILSADSPNDIINWVNTACIQKQQAYINVGYINDISIFGPFYIPKHTACFNCTQYTPNNTKRDPFYQIIKDIENNFRPATYAPVNGVASMLAVGDILRYLGGFGEILSKNKRIGMHFNSLKIEEQIFHINKDCLCQK
ncbi:Sulfur carrier protein ThiS adenylyltransferase [Moraxella caprae]|uniref:Sulfur carrier protein ThiS adenylyltransferase n=1 Tax=Moraxella caprae TaxID=90240 RepID=A0A378R1K7_9GAMM|nr:ThiF family adenylyltransferase [Moraxella caprae]STZ08511.1 Sulfur carrier protein ThiS adenylyltransferase [Moraxella caprae]